MEYIYIWLKKIIRIRFLLKKNQFHINQQIKDGFTLLLLHSLSVKCVLIYTPYLTVYLLIMWYWQLLEFCSAMSYGFSYFWCLPFSSFTQTYPSINLLMDSTRLLLRTRSWIRNVDLPIRGRRVSIIIIT